MPTINWPTVSVISTGSIGNGLTNVSSVGGGAAVVKGQSATTGFFRSLVAGDNITLTSGTNTIEISGSGVANVDAQLIGSGEFIVGGSGSGDIYFRGIRAGDNVTITSGTSDIFISSSLPSGNRGDQFMHDGSDWTTGSYLSKYVVGPDSTDRYSTLKEAIAAITADGAATSSDNPAVVYMKPKLGTSLIYNEGAVTMPPNVIVQGLSYGGTVGMPGVVLQGNFTFASSSSANGFRNVSIRNSSGNLISVTGNSAQLFLASCNVTATSAAIPISINGSGCSIRCQENTVIVTEGSANGAVQNANGNFTMYNGIIQGGSAGISYRSTATFSDAYASFNNAIFVGTVDFTTSGAFEAFGCRHLLTSNSQYPIHFANAGTAPNNGGCVYKNCVIQYGSGLTGPSGPWIDVDAGEASVYTGCVVLDESGLRTINPYTDNVDMNISEWDSEVSTSFIRRTFITDADPDDRQILRFYDNGSSQDQAQWQDEEPVTTNADSSIALPSTSTTRHLICSNAGVRSVTLFNANVRPGSITIIDGAGTAGSAVISVTGSGGQTINGSNLVNSNNGAATFVSDGTSEWYRIS